MTSEPEPLQNKLKVRTIGKSSEGRPVFGAFFRDDDVKSAVKWLESEIKGVERCMLFTDHKYPCQNKDCKRREYCPLAFGGSVGELLRHAFPDLMEADGKEADAK